MEITIKNFADLNKLVRICSKHSGNISARSGRFVADAKSLMGMIALDLSKPLTIMQDDIQDKTLLEELKAAM